MKLAPCPDCKNRISFSATMCPNCGRPIKAGELIRPQDEPLSLGHIILFVIFAVLLIIFLINAGQKGRKIREDDERLKQRILDSERRRSGG